jgi:hypothetical protein
MVILPFDSVNDCLAGVLIPPPPRRAAQATSAPYSIFRYVIVLVPVEIPHIHDRTPGQFRVAVTDGFWKPATCFRDNLQAAGDRVKNQQVFPEAVDRLALGPVSSEYDVVANVEQSMER